MADKLKITKEVQFVLDTICNRRSVRFYKSDHVSDEAIETIIEAARWAPSAHNFQPTEFVVIRDDETRKHFSEIAQGASKRTYGDLSKEEAKQALLSLPDHLQEDGRILQHISGEFYKYIYTAPVILLVCVDKRSPYYEADGWMAVQNLMVAAKALGLGTIATVRGIVNPKDKAEIRKYLEVPDGYEILGIVLVGYPDEEPVVLKRDLDELIHYERFGNFEKQ